MVIRQLTNEDIPQAMELKILCWTEELAGKAENELKLNEEIAFWIDWLNTPDENNDVRVFIGVFDNEKLLGVAAGSFVVSKDLPDEGIELNGLWVYPEHRGKGIALKMIQHILDVFIPLGVTRMIVYNPHYAPSNTFYQKFGGKIIEQEYQIDGCLLVDIYEFNTVDLQAAIIKSLTRYKRGKGTIIWLNGVSSSGKSTLAKTLQERLPKPFYTLSNDMFTNDIVSPDKFINLDWRETYYRVLIGMYHAVRAFSDIGIDPIVDDVLLRVDDRLEQCVELLCDYPVLFVHVLCPIDELRRREKERSDRGIGQGESQLTELNPQDTYDITVNTHEDSVERCADRIIEFLDFPEKRKAFKILRQQHIGLMPY
jgi:chloramphenicol 3-O-phosphotransferase/GNAT superfamily N-acetyltransferase